MSKPFPILAVFAAMSAPALQPVHFAEAQAMPPADTPVALVDADRRFLTLAAQAGSTEVEAGKLAESRGNADAVKRFGRRMAADHSAGGAKLKELAARKHFSLPATIGPENEQHLATLRALRGTAFDGPYADMMVKGHERVVSAFQEASTGATDADVRAFAVDTLPMLTEHLALARRMIVAERITNPQSPSRGR